MLYLKKSFNRRLHEYHFSTKEKEKKKSPWFFSSSAHRLWPSDYSSASSQKAAKIDGLGAVLIYVKARAKINSPKRF